MSDIEKIKEIVSAEDENVVISDVAEMTPDASMRRYFRISLENSKWQVPSVVAMVFDSVKPAEVGDGPAVNADEAYVELTKYFQQRDISVPDIYCDARDKSVLVIEDLGDCLLGSLLGEDKQGLVANYKKAIDYANKISEIPKDDALFFFQRSFNEALYLKEMAEYQDYFLLPAGLSGSQKEVQDAAFAHIVRELLAMPQCLVHRDYHSWNILLDKACEVRLIDFQDACIGPAPYDVISLLHDRDTDLALGEEVVRELQDYYFKNSSVTKEQYNLTSLQRDLKVVGRFGKFVKERGLTRYEKWIASTQRRVVARLGELSNDHQELESFLGVIRELALDK